VQENGAQTGNFKRWFVIARSYNGKHGKNNDSHKGEGLSAIWFWVPVPTPNSRNEGIPVYIGQFLLEQRHSSFGQQVLF
jgi:hypothetical protein